MSRSWILAVIALGLSSCKTEPRACSKMKELCGTETKTCTDLRESVLGNLGQSAVDSLDGCVLQADTCSTAAGCATGEAAKAGLEAASHFADGFARAIAPKSADECIKEAKTPAERMGCTTGAFGKSAAETAGEFAKGLDRATR